MKLTKRPPLGPVFDSYSVAVCVYNSGAENDGVKRSAFRRFGLGKCPETPYGCRPGRVSKCPTGFAAHDLPLSTPLTHHSSYQGDKLSRLALPPELVECHSSCGISRLAAACKPGAYFAEAIGVQLNLPTEGAGFKIETPSALIFLALRACNKGPARTPIAALSSRHPRDCATTCHLSDSGPIEVFNTGTAFAIIVS
jgi:hypothetical protein